MISFIRFCTCEGKFVLPLAPGAEKYNRLYVRVEMIA